MPSWKIGNNALHLAANTSSAVWDLTPGSNNARTIYLLADSVCVLVDSVCVALLNFELKSSSGSESRFDTSTDRNCIHKL